MQLMSAKPLGAAPRCLGRCRHRDPPALGSWQAGLSCAQNVHCCDVYVAASSGCWTLCKAVLGNIKAAASLVHHLDRLYPLLLQAFHDRAPLVLLSQGKQAEAERSGMLRARHEHETFSMLHAHPVEAGWCPTADGLAPDCPGLPPHVAPIAQACEGLWDFSWRLKSGSVRVGASTGHRCALGCSLCSTVPAWRLMTP